MGHARPRVDLVLFCIFFTIIYLSILYFHLFVCLFDLILIIINFFLI
jgi:hypothetical protein